MINENPDKPQADWSLFQNEENQSFVSSHHSTNNQEPTKMNYKQFKHLKYMNDRNKRNKLQLFPLIYLVLSMAVLLSAVLSQFQYARAQTFPLFLELPLQNNQAFIIGNAFMSFLGIIVYYFVFTINQKRTIQKGYFPNQVSVYNFSSAVFLGGVLAHLFFFAFAILPADHKSTTGSPQFLYTEDRIFLTMSFMLNFVFTAYYIYFNASLRNIFQSLSISYQIKTALFTVICFLFTAFLSVNFISICLGMPLFQQQEPQIEDQLSAAEDIIALMVGEIYSTLAYSLYIVNSLFMGMYYYDLKIVNFLMTINQEPQPYSNNAIF